MSRMQNCRSSNTSPLPKADIFMSFLDPTPRPNPSPLNTFSTRTESPLNKSNKSLRTSASPQLASKLELSEKQNQMLQERNKVLIKEKQQLKKKLSREKTSPFNTFKNHAKVLTQKTFMEKLVKGEEGFNDLCKKITGSLKVISWVKEQPQECRLAFVKPALDEVFANLNGIDVEFEARVLAAQEKNREKISKLEEIVFKLENREEREHQEAISALVKKNSELVIENCLLLKNIESLKFEVEKLKNPEIQEEFRVKIVEDFKNQLFLDKRKEDLEVTRSLIELEERFEGIKKYAEGLAKEVDLKNIQIGKLYREIAEGKLRSIKDRVKDENQPIKRSLSGEKTLRNKPPKHPEAGGDLISYTCCLAAALEDFLL